MPMSKRTRAREERFDKMKSRQLIKSIWKKKLPPGGFGKTLIESVEKVNTVDDLAKAMPSAAESSSATEASLARAASSISVVSLPPPKNAHNPRKRKREQLRIMMLGEPGRLSLLASTFSSAESRAHLTKPGEPEMSWEEVKAAVRESPSPSPLKRNFDDGDDEEEERPQPAMMSRFEERTALIDVYALPTDPSTTYHPTMPRRKQAREQLRIMKLGEPGRLSLLASTFSSAESRARLIKPGEPEMSWEEVKAAVRESPSPSPSPLKRKYGGDEEKKETPWPAKMSRFEERTDLINVYALPTDPYTTYHPTMPRRKHALPTDDEEKLHCQKKQRCDGIPLIFRPSRKSTTRDEISPIFGPITHPRFDAVECESPHQGPKDVDALNYPAPSVPKVGVESFLPPAQAVASAISVAINNATRYVSKIQIERSPPAEAITNIITPSSQQPRDTQIMIPDSPVTSPQAQRANSSHSDSDSDKAREGDKITLISSESMRDTIRTRAQICLRKSRRRARRSNDKRLVKKMEESQRFARELGPIKHTASRPPHRLDEDKDKEASEPPEDIEELVESNPVVENMHEIGNEARRRADFWTEKSEVVEAKWEQMKKDKKTLIKMRERILKHMSRKESPLRE